MAVTGIGGTAGAVAGANQILKGDEDPVSPVGENRLDLSPRQAELDRRWAYYRCSQYATRRVAWDGSRVVGQSEWDTIAMAGYVPPGFYIANSETLPIQFRKPTTPHHLCKVIVDRFTSLLFGQKRHPKVNIDGDDDTEQFINAVIEEGRLWAAMMQARMYGGATGTAIVGFKLLSGKPQFEVFDPRWCQAKFLDRTNLVMDSLEYRHTFKQEYRDPETGDWKEVDFWYRRVIDRTADTVFEPVPVRRGTSAPPVWTPASRVEHGFGFCPVIWIQNQPGDTEIDGDPDCLGIYELVEAIDRLNSQSERSILANCDPTVVVTTDAQMGEVRKGSNNALKLPGGGSASYMEMSGTGVVQAREQAMLYKEAALEIAQCVLEQPDGQRTATEVERNFAAMLARADTFREQYGELGVKRLINMVLVAAIQIMRPRIMNGSVTRFSITLPKRKDGQEQRLGKGPFQATLAWPPYFEPSLNDVNAAVQAATGAKVSGLVDDEHAAKFVAPYFNIEDTDAVVEAVSSSSNATQAAIEKMALAGEAPGEGEGGGGDEGKAADVAMNGAQVTALADLVKSVALGELPSTSAVEIITVGFPVSRPQAEAMVRDAAKMHPPSDNDKKQPQGEESNAATTDLQGFPSGAPEDEA